MKPTACLLLLLAGCVSVSRTTNTAAGRQVNATTEAQVFELADSVFSAAQARNADRFAGYFLDRPGFAYLINKRQLNSVAEVRETFSRMLAGQRSFEPRWGNRRVQTIGSTAAIVTGEFSTTAVRSNGESWGASGVVTFVAVREASGWRVVNWHTSE